MHGLYCIRSNHRMQLRHVEKEEKGAVLYIH
jgi:hypothetical protein